MRAAFHLPLDLMLRRHASTFIPRRRRMLTLRDGSIGAFPPIPARAAARSASHIDDFFLSFRIDRQTLQ